MIATYPAGLPCPLLAGHESQEPNNFKLSQLPYARKQRHVVRDNITFKFGINVGYTELLIFKEFFDNTLLGGVAPFTATWLIHGEEISRTIRFATSYRSVDLGGLYYGISSTCEVLP